MALNFISAQEAAEQIKNGDNVGFSGFTASGTPKVVTEALAELAIKEHEAGREFKINMFTGASTNDHVDGALARANAINMRTPYQSSPDLRKRLNAHDAHYFDLHLSELAQKMRYGVFGKLNVAIIEAADINDNGEIILGTGVGIAPTIAAMADKIEVNEAYAEEYINALKTLAEKFGITNDISVSNVARNQDVFSVTKQSLDEEEVWSLVLTAAETAVDNFIKERETEGKRMAEDVLSRTETILKYVAVV